MATKSENGTKTRPRDPGDGQIQRTLLTLNGLGSGDMDVSAHRCKSQTCPSDDLRRNSPRLSGTKLDLRKKVKNATRNKAHIAACSGSERLKWSNAACKIEGVIAYFRATAWPKKRLVPLSKS